MKEGVEDVREREKERRERKRGAGHACMVMSVMKRCGVYDRGRIGILYNCGSLYATAS